MLQFDPPYDSPIEQIMACNLDKYMAEDATLEKQFLAPTSHADFHLNLVVSLPTGRRIAFECDGREFHLDTQRDSLRDALILGHKRVESIYRFSGQDIHYHVEDCLFWATARHAAFFSPRGLCNLGILASADAHKRMEYVNSSSQGIFYIPYTGTRRCGPHSAFMQRMDAKDDSRLVAECVAFAAEHPGLSFDYLVELYRIYSVRPTPIRKRETAA